MKLKDQAGQCWVTRHHRGLIARSVQVPGIENVIHAWLWGRSDEKRDLYGSRSWGWNPLQAPPPRTPGQRWVDQDDQVEPIDIIRRWKLLVGRKPKISSVSVQDMSAVLCSPPCSSVMARCHMSEASVLEQLGAEPRAMWEGMWPRAGVQGVVWRTSNTSSG